MNENVSVRFLSLITALILSAGATAAQERAGTVRVEVRSPAGPLASASVTTGGATAETNADGIATMPAAAGKVEVVVTKEGFARAAATVDVLAGQEAVVRVELVPQPVVEEEVTVVASTRTGRRLEDQPMRVDVLGREEIEEKMLMTPGDIVMMLNEMGGLRVQATSPSLGAASVRIQGMRGRYTRFLSDGLPLFGEQPGGLGLLQIPPMDLGQVEVIKGVASALYGAGAMGGVVNLISRRPGTAAEHEVLFNQSTRGATDAVLWLSTPLESSWGLTLLASGHRQGQVDVDDDGWSDMAKYGRGVVRPRVTWQNDRGASFFATAGVTHEERRGGTMPDATLAATGLPYRESLETTRVDAGALGQSLVGGRFVLTARAAVATQRHDHLFGDTRERDRHDTVFAEATIRGAAGAHTWVAGAAVERDAYDPTDVPRFKYTFITPGVFVQDDIAIRPWLLVSASGRVDWHSEYGTFFSPRGSVLLRGGGWTSRFSAGQGFYASTPLTEETEAAGLTRLSLAAPLEAEGGRSFSIDLGTATGNLSYTVTVFASHVSDPVHVDRDTTYAIRNLDGATTNRGGELLATYRQAPFAVTGTYTYVQSRETDGGVRDEVALTPRHSVGIVAMAESEEKGRVGLEVYYTGRQRLDANPYRDESEPYVIVGLLAERRFARFSVFVNGENLTGVRQSHWNPLVRPAQAADGRWTVDAWAPLEGRVVNGGVRIRF
jgi:outer membrane receptor for ferrienterochelin and colicins